MDDHKFAVIFNENAHGKFEDGELKMFGNSKSGELHIKAILDFIQAYFKDDPVLSKLNIRHQPTVAAYFLVERGYVVFLNSTDFTEKYLKKYGKNGILFLPNTITDKQLLKLKYLLVQLSDYDILVNTDLRVVDGFLDSRTLTNIDGGKKDVILKLVDDYYDKGNNRTK